MANKIEIRETDGTVYKRCTKCGEWLEATTEYFHKDRKKQLKLNSQCKECRNKYRKQHYFDNKEYTKEQIKQYNQTFQGKLTMKNKVHKRRALKKQGRGYTLEQEQEMLKFFGGKCAYSGEPLIDINKTIDHIKPLNKGGEHEIWNLVPMLDSYNSSKHNKNMLDWYIKQPFFDENRLEKIYQWQDFAFNKYK